MNSIKEAPSKKKNRKKKKLQNYYIEIYITNNYRTLCNRSSYYYSMKAITLKKIEVWSKLSSRLPASTISLGMLFHKLTIAIKK